MTIETNTKQFTFQAPEFYPNGPIDGRANEEGVKVFIHRDGEAIAYYEQSPGLTVVLRTPDEFRNAFPDGNIPSDIEWKLNAWFDLYTEDGTHLDCVTHDLVDAMKESIHYLIDHEEDL